VVSIAPFSTPACPDCSQNITQTQKTALFACFRSLIFHPFSRWGGQLTPFVPMCGRPWLRSIKFRFQTRRAIDLSAGRCSQSARKSIQACCCIGRVQADRACVCKWQVHGQAAGRPADSEGGASAAWSPIAGLAVLTPPPLPPPGRPIYDHVQCTRAVWASSTWN